jgi:hypothetical protein
VGSKELKLEPEKPEAEAAIRSLEGGGRMVWSIQVPTKEGWYWFSALDGSDERIVSVYHQGLDGNKPLTASGENFALFDLNGHRWAGPLERPR